MTASEIARGFIIMLILLSLGQIPAHSVVILRHARQLHHLASTVLVNQEQLHTTDLAGSALERYATVGG